MVSYVKTSSVRLKENFIEYTYTKDLVIYDVYLTHPTIVGRSLKGNGVPTLYYIKEITVRLSIVSLPISMEICNPTVVPRNTSFFPLNP